jgi:hypothetical protein
MGLQTVRHDAIFNKETFVDLVHLIGTGSVGSHVALQLAKLGIGTHPTSGLHLYDGDIIEAHNIANQAYSVADIGHKKAEVLAREYTQWSNGLSSSAHSEFVRDRIPLSGVVMTCLDSMEARKAIGETSIWGNPEVKLLIDARMDVNTAVVFTINPNNERHVDLWNEYWFPDTQATDAPGCGGNQTVISAVLITAALAVQQLIGFASGRREFPNHLRLSFNTGEFKFTQW